ncbi:hypothetical protein TOPH_06899 [Tolypocladium ophioglossoides CBS 100239]|uniref:Uncharacterized protein n=1 Tax=Tolypocladium ophioglossoides (strain CBS 100239) TaxID=1163406 RepID=A0A0L0N362_TOLOC|nr:hypothetical protein TOPH_06899 [Tolypocladium ophioglossoides CBS 100239]
MPQTILDVLVQPNPELDSSSVPGGQNTFSRDWIPVAGWRPWVDFTYENLLSIYRQPLTANWRDPPSIDMASAFDRQIRDENSMDYFLAKYMWPLVNGALTQASSILEWGNEVFYLGPGSWCHGTGPPDWGLVSNYRAEQGKFWNLLPGDTKLSAKWRPDMSQSQNDSERYQWTLPVSQVSTYAAESACRYGFIVTDQTLVVLRFTKESIGEGLASTRPSRVTHQRFASGDTDISSVLESMSLDSFGAQSYADDDLANAANAEFLPPEYAVISRTAHGRGRLTIKLSIFCLCLMAAGGNGSVDYDYPPLDSWRQVSRHKFTHNSSGIVATKLLTNATLYDPQQSDLDDAAQAGPSNYQASQSEHSQIGHDSQPPSPTHAKSSSKYTTVEVKRRNGLFCFYDMKKQLRKTKKSEWTRSQNPIGWVYQGGRHAYFTEHLP